MTAPRDATPPEWAMKEADAIDLCGYDHDRTCCLETREEIARAIAAAYARGREDAAKVARYMRQPMVAEEIMAKQGWGFNLGDGAIKW